MAFKLDGSKVGDPQLNSKRAFEERGRTQWIRPGQSGECASPHIARIARGNRDTCPPKRSPVRRSTLATSLLRSYASSSKFWIVGTGKPRVQEIAGVLQRTRKRQQEEHRWKPGTTESLKRRCALGTSNVSNGVAARHEYQYLYQEKI